MPAGDENVLQSAHDGDGSDVRSGSFATDIDHSGHFRLSPKSGSTADMPGGPVRANMRHERPPTGAALLLR